jgi:hypothetical protein
MTPDELTIQTTTSVLSRKFTGSVGGGLTVVQRVALALGLSGRLLADDDVLVQEMGWRADRIDAKVRRKQPTEPNGGGDRYQS